MTDDYISRVRAEARTAIHLLVKASGGEFTDRPLFRDEPHMRTIREPEPAAGIRAALAFEREHHRRCLEYVRYAREDGLTWHAIGEAMGFADYPPRGMTSAAEHAFRYAVPGHVSADYFTWTCLGDRSCGGLVRDYGPELAPHDAELGHAEGCARFAATVAEWDRNWADE